MTEQDKYGMEQLAEYLDMRIRYEEKTIKEIRNKLDRDYLYHFAWTGEELFKSHFMVKQYGELRQVIRQVGAPEKVHGYIRHKREECLKELVSGSIRRRSTDEISNLAHTLPAGMHAETGQGLYGLRTASLDEASPRGSENKNGAGNDEKEVERIKNIMEWNNRTPMS